MPIPLAQIPNAPQAGPEPVLTRVPGANTNLAGVAQTLMQDGLRQGAYDGPAEGMQTIGAAISDVSRVPQKISAVISDARERKLEAQDDFSLATIDRLRRESAAKFKGTLQEKPENEWLPSFESDFAEKDPKLIADYPLSEKGRQRLAIQTQQFLAETNTGLITAANRSFVERGTGELLALFSRQGEAGDVAGQRVTMARAVNLGILRADQAQAYLKSADETRNNNMLTAAMQQNPRLFLEDINEFIKTGESETLAGNFKGEDKAIQLQKWQGIASSHLRQIQTDKGNEIHNAILGGEITTEEQIKAAAGDDFAEKEVQRWVKVLNSNVKYDAKTVTDLRTAVAGYDPRADKDLSVYYKLRTQIETTIPKDIQGPLANELYQSYTDNRDGKMPKAATRLKSALFTTIDTMNGQGLLGETGTSTKKGESGKIVNAEQFISSFERAQNLKDDVEKYLTENPEATPEQATEWFKSKVGGNAAEAASKAFQGQFESMSRWNPLNYRMGGGGLGMPPVIQFKGDDPKPPGADAIKQKTGPASIRYNNPGAMYPGPSSEKFGATETKIIGGGHKIAVFPDAESGAAAQFDLLDRAYTGKTLREAITKWSGENSVPTYLSVIKREAGIDADTTLTRDMMRDPKIAIPLVRAMARHEAGREYPLSAEQWKSAHQRAFSS